MGQRKPDTTDTDHDKRIAENYVFDEVLGIYVPRSEFENRVKYNNDQTSSKTEFCGNLSDNDIAVRFPSRPKQEQPDIDKNIDLTPSIPSKQSRNAVKRLRPLSDRNR